MSSETDTQTVTDQGTKALWLMRDEKAPDPEFSYCAGSLLIHWVTVVAVILLFFTRGKWHETTGIVLSLPILFRFWWRWSRGFPRVPDESILLSSFERLAIISNLIGLLMLTLSGLAMSVFSGAEIFGALGQWCADAEISDQVIAIAQYIHNGAAMTLYASVIVHVLSAFRHARYRSTGIFQRIIKPLKNGA